jgi:hypothetical protein
VKSFTDDQLRRGLDAVILAHQLRGDRCLICGEENDDAHDAQPHGFVTPDPMTVFLEAARERSETAHGEGRAHD